MSTSTTSYRPTAPRPGGPPVAGHTAAGAGEPRRAAPAVPFTRLFAVELRKQVDTRAGLWLLAVIFIVNAALSALVLFFSEPELITWRELVAATSPAQLLLLPLIGILAATSEWSQRTALTTFTLEPRRTRVNGAKLASAVTLGLGVMVLSMAAAGVLNVAGTVWRDGDGSWGMEWPMLAGTAAALVLLVTQGVAFGLALLSTPIAIVAYLAVPTLWSILTSFIAALREPAMWLDINVTMLPLTSGELTATEWAQLGTSVAVWVLVPLGIGLWRTARRDVN